MKILKNNLENKLNLRTEENYPVEGVEFIDVTPLIMSKEILCEIVNKFVENIKKLNVDYIVAPEARGFLLGSAIAVKLGIGVIPVRKKGNLPPTCVECQFEYEKEYGVDILELPKLYEDEYNNKRFYIVDDIYATGNTMAAIGKSIEKLGGIVAGDGVIINIIELNDNKDVFSLIDVNEK